MLVKFEMASGLSAEQQLLLKLYSSKCLGTICEPPPPPPNTVFPLTAFAK